MIPLACNRNLVKGAGEGREKSKDAGLLQGRAKRKPSKSGKRKTAK